MTEIEASNQFARNSRSPLPIEVIERARREKDFYDRYCDPSQVPDEVLVVPKNVEDLDMPMEIARLAPSLAGKTICDYGCGYGVTSAFFALRDATTFAFDVSGTNVGLAARTSRVNGVADRVFLQVAQGENTGYRSDEFDLVFGKAVLHHLDLSLAAREIYRILKPGGAAAFYEPLGENRLLEWVRDCPLRSAKRRHTSDERSILYSDLLLLKAGFDRVSYRETGLLTLVKTVCRKVEVGMIAIPRGRPVLDALGKCDRWIFSHIPNLRRLAHYIVILMFKDGEFSDAGRLLGVIAHEMQHSTVNGPGRRAFEEAGC